ncbi:hypothetical protein L5515_016162 [Caenorhabditis briggsae]|uniref:Apple domain-containing protein n=1 Tax=Caenorhabditis briggsae TaxID=6238 RepID=A0AAE9FBF3_CAEBR|nr:hypothetical protein L5515_016162 [Caenorhabditis briggsae]
MIVYSILLLALLSNPVNAKSVPKKDVCDENKTHFFVIDNASLQSSDPIVYKGTSEEECLKTCTQNRDTFNRPIQCSSFTYDHASLSCTIHSEKSLPVGSAQIETAVGKRYFEKTCISYSLPEQCGLSQFIRVDQSVLVGYAVNMTLTDSIESCVAQCVQETDCKSAMYFYEDGECITNKESALTKPAGFTKEENDKVIYFQNGCDLNAVKKPIITSESAEVAADETVEEEIKPVVNIQISETTPKPDGQLDKVVDEVKNVEKETPSNKSEEDGEQKDITEEKGSEQNSETAEDGEYEEDGDDVTEETAVEEVPTTFSTTVPTTTTEAIVEETEAPTPNRIKNLIQKKMKKHPKNFGSKTYEILKKQNTVKKPKINFPENEDSLELTDDSRKSEEQQEPEETYFSEWSDWTPCTKSNERQVRRRRCLNLRKCLGALMQVQNCPEVIPTTTPQNNEMIRSIVSADGDEYDEPIAVDNISVDPVPSRTLPVLNEQLWGPWQGTCQQFASSQPCNNGSMIGFESRECIAKDPAQCEGPFFRYCTLTC